MVRMLPTTWTKLQPRPVTSLGIPTKKVVKVTKRGSKGVAHGTKVAAKDTGKGFKTGTEKTGEGLKDAVTK